MNSLPLASLVVGACMALAGAAQAASVAPVDAAGNFTVVDNTGPHAPETFNFNVQPTTNPNPVVYYDTNPPTNQSRQAIAELIAADFGIPVSTLDYAGGCGNIGGGCTGLTTTSSTFSLSGVPTFDYLAIHYGGGELFFHWAQPITAMTLLALDGFPGGLSNYRTYLATPLPGALVLFLSGLGFLGLRRKMAQPKVAAEPAMA